MITAQPQTIAIVLLTLVVGGCGGRSSSRSYVYDEAKSAPMESMLEESFAADPAEGRGPGMAGDRFATIVENPPLPAARQPLSTFSIDVDTASYSKTRMYLLQRNTLPPPDAVRIEEYINYFDYGYEGPHHDVPFAMHVEVAEAPWQPKHRLVRIALKGREIHRDRSPANLVFLIDVSGSMDYPNKLPLVKEGLRMLVSRLGPEDQVALVVYAGAAGLVLPPTRGDQKGKIEGAVARLHAGGSTNGGEGIRLAYKIAREQQVSGGVNRVILCSDGDFNVGTTNTGELVRLSTEQAKEGIFLSVLGFGTGNHNDAMLEELSNKANGNYAFVDTSREARKVLVDQMDGTLVTIAKDVKIQVEFNPARVASHRLIGYENRVLAAQDFNDDRKDAGDIGAGHTVTAFYEVVPVGAETSGMAPVDPLRYRDPASSVPQVDNEELLTVKVRYKNPNAANSLRIVEHVKDNGQTLRQASHEFQFAAAVAGFGMLLRNSEYRGDLSYAAVHDLAAGAMGQDRYGYRSEFLEMVGAANRLSGGHAIAGIPHRSSLSSPIGYYGPANSRPANGLILVLIAIIAGVLVWSATIVSVLTVVIVRSRASWGTAGDKFETLNPKY